MNQLIWRGLLRLGPFVFFSAVGSCSPDIHEICQSELADFEKELSTIASALNVSEKNPDRAIASKKEKAPKLPQVTEDQRDDWMSWARGGLGDLQEYLDVISANPDLHQIRDDLTVIANHVVMFYGYTERGNTKRMMDVAYELNSKTQAVRKAICHESARSS